MIPATQPSERNTPFNRELRSLVTTGVRECGACGVILFRSLPGRAASQGERCVSLLPLAEYLRARIRCTDDVLLDDTSAIALVLTGTDLVGARAAGRRLADAVDDLSFANATDARLLVSVRLGIGLTALYAPVLDSPSALRRALRAADVAERLTQVALPSQTAGGMPATTPAPGASPCLPSARIPAVVRLSARSHRSPGSAGQPRASRSQSAPISTPYVAPTILPHDTFPPVVVPTITVATTVSTTVAALPSVGDTPADQRPPHLPLPFLRIPARLPAGCRRALPAALAHELRAVVVGRGRGALTVAFAAPASPAMLQRLHEATGLDIFPVLAPADEIEHALARS